MLIKTGTTSWVLLFMPTLMILLALPAPAISVTLGNSETSGNTSISNSVNFKKPQNLSIATSSAPSSSSSLLSSSATITSKEQATALPSLAPLAPSSSSSSSSLPAASVSSPPPTSSIFAWGHVTKYSRILYDESFVVKGPIILDVNYPEIDNSNSFTIIGIQAYANDGEDVTPNDATDLDTGLTVENSQSPVYPVKGGIGYNYTIIRFSLNSTRVMHYTLVIHGVEV